MNIGTASEKSGLPAKTIRYYEEIGLIRPLRSDNGYRAFRDSDLHKLAFIGRARGLGYGGFRVVNLFAWRATDPRALRAVADPIGPDNDAALDAGALWADDVLCGWGGHGGLLGRDARVAALLRASGRPLFHLGLTGAGQPKHPLYIGYAQAPVLWD